MGGINRKLEMVLTISREIAGLLFPELKLMSQKVNLVCLKCNATRIIQYLSIIVSCDALLLCFK